MATPDELNNAYTEFWNDLLLAAEAEGNQQHEAFFSIYSETASENGDCADLQYSPVLKDGARPLQVDGYAFDRDRGELHLAICDFNQERELQAIRADGINQVFNRVRNFCKLAVDTEFLDSLEETSPAFELAWTIQANLKAIKRIRCVMFSNRRLATRKKTLEAGRVLNADMTFNIIDFQRYTDILSAQGGIEPIELDIQELNGSPLPCLEAHMDDSDYESYLVVMPGTLLARIYGLYGARLMEQNVRTFLQARTKTNKGIITTINDEPERFFAYNNGITATASSLTKETGSNGVLGITALNDLQIVNGGQTTASLLYAADKSKSDLSKVFVQMKLSVVSGDLMEEVVPLISRYANTQNKVSEADFFSNHPFHVEMQKISRKLAAPVAEGQLAATKWFYERARGQYANELATRTSADKRKFQIEYPKSQLIQKTDMAKYQMTFEAKPHIVSLGAQKCFLQYAQRISQRWEKAQTEFNEDFFKRAVSQAIIFKSLDKAVGTSDWYKDDRGYKANIVTYAIGWLVHHLEDIHQRAIDFDRIWKMQSVPDEILQTLMQLAQCVSKEIRKTPSGVSNVTEYAKSQACWNTLSKLPLIPDTELKNVTISIELDKTRAKDAKVIKAIDTDIEFDDLIYKNADRMETIRDDAKNKKVLSPKSDKALQKVASGNFNLTKVDRNALKNLFHRLEELGSGPSSWT